jgi:hypothetical protein
MNSLETLNNELEDISLYSLIENLSKEKHSGLYSRLQSIRHRQDHILSILDQIGCDFERNIVYIQENMRTVDNFRTKLNNVRIYMMRITDRVESLQVRLNKIRVSLPTNSMVMMERPDEHGIEKHFYYKCIVPSGLKYRSKPSTSSAVIPGAGVKHKDIVIVKERVFICKEETVFLHVDGCGWLLENIEKVKCLQRIGPSWVARHQIGQPSKPSSPNRKVNDEERDSMSLDSGNVPYSEPLVVDSVGLDEELSPPPSPSVKQTYLDI